MELLKNYPILNELDQPGKRTIVKLCSYLENEAYIVDQEDNVYHLIGRRKEKIFILCQKNVLEFSYAYHTEPSISNFHVLALTEHGRIYYWGSDAYAKVIQYFIILLIFYHYIAPSTFIYVSRLSF